MARVSFDFLDGSDFESDGDSEAGDALLRAYPNPNLFYTQIQCTKAS
jgi:hypothetical protein